MTTDSGAYPTEGGLCLCCSSLVGGPMKCVVGAPEPLPLDAGATIAPHAEAGALPMGAAMHQSGAGFIPHASSMGGPAR